MHKDNKLKNKATMKVAFNVQQLFYSRFFILIMPMISINIATRYKAMAVLSDKGLMNLFVISVETRMSIPIK